MKKYDKVYFIKIYGEKSYIGVNLKKGLTILTRDEAILASATTATPVYVETLADLNNFFTIYKKPLKNHTLRNAGLTAAGLALVLGMSGAYALNSPDAANILGAFNAPKTVAERTVDVNQDQAPEATIETEETKEANETEKASEQEVRTFDSVLSESTSEKQKQVLSMMANYIRYFNGDFANTYKEVVELTDENGNLTGEKIEVKPALKWEYEVPALTIAYNGYSAQKLHSIFNGKDLNADQLDKDYKVATLQLFGAYVISDRSMPVNLANLVESEEGKAFVQKYEDMFYSIKEAKTDEEKVELVTKFYQELYKDFPIEAVSKMDFSEQEVGIAHSDVITTFNGRELDSYKLAITPMICAVETMYQNLSIDATLQDEAINYFNLLGECNLAYKEFMKAEVASGCGEYDDTLADYDELSDLIIKELQDKNAYVIDDMHRELTLLTRFQEEVNGHFNIIDGEMDGSWWYYTDTNTEVTVTYSDPVTRTETHTRYKKDTKTWTTDDRQKAVDHVGEEAVKKAEEQVDQKIEEENRKAKEEAEKKADKEQERQQKVEDEKREKLEEEVKKEDEQFKEDIKDANEQIKKNNDNNTENDKPVNEEDFKGHEVDFDDDHSNSNGDLDDSVKDITTDGTGADQALPDPNATGDEFDNRTDSDPVEEHHEESHNDSPAPAETVNFEVDDNDQYEEYTTTGSASDEELVDNYIASLEAATPEELAAIKTM